MIKTTHYIKELYEKLWKGDLEKSFEIFKKIIENDELKSFRKDVIQQKVRFEQNEAKNNKGLIDWEQCTLERSKIINSLLEIFDKIKEELIEITKLKKEYEQEQNINTISKSNSKKGLLSPDEELLINSFRLVKSKSKDLEQSSSLQSKLELKQLKRKIVENFFINGKTIKLDDETSIVNEYISTLFNEIIELEEINSGVYSEIIEIKANKDKYTWYERSLIISALSLRLLKDQKMNKDAVKSIELLIDFTNETENENIHELENKAKALIGLMLGLYTRHNKINRYIHLKKKLTQLQNNKEIQTGLSIIHKIFGDYKETVESLLLPKQIFNFSFFKKPENWFIPFYENNSIKKETFDGINNPNIDFDEIENELSKNFPSAFKFYYCLNIQNGIFLKTTKLKTLQEKEDAKLVLKIYNNDLFQSYYKSVLSLFQFLFEKENSGEIFNRIENFNYYNTKLKDIVLSNIEKFKLGYQYNYDKKRYKSALNNLQKLEELKYESPQVFKLSGDCHLKLKNYSDSIKYYEKYLECDPKNLSIIKRLASLYKQEDKIEEAIELLLKVKGETDEYVCYLLGECYRSKKEYENALNYFQKISDSSKTSKVIKKKIIYCLFRLNKFDDGIQIFDKLKISHPDDIFIDIQLADVYKVCGNYQEALDIYLSTYESKTKHKNNVIFFLELSMTDCFLGLKRKEEAYKYWNLLIPLNKKNSKIISDYYGYIVRIQSIIQILKNEENFLKAFKKMPKKDRQIISSALKNEKYCKEKIILNSSEEYYNSMIEKL